MDTQIAPPPAGFFACSVGEGCLLGIEALRSKAGLPDSWKWEENVTKNGAISPFTIIAADEMQGNVFTIDVFENLFGSVKAALQSG